MAPLRRWIAVAASGAFLIAGVAAGRGENAPTYNVDISSGHDDLDTQLEAVSRLVQAQGKPPPGLTGLEQRAQTDKAAFEAVMRSEGYYDGAVDVAIDDTKAQVLVAMRVTVGQRYVLGTCSIDYTLPAPRDAPQTCKDIGLNIGAFARAVPIIAATELLLQKLGSHGRPDAKVINREAVVDHLTHKMALAFHTDPGREARFGGVVVKGVKDTAADFLAGLITWRSGAVYDVRELEKYRKRLSDLNLFDRLMVKPDTAHQDATGVTPIAVTAHESLPRSFGGGVSYATDTGPGLKAFWEHRNFGGRALHLRTDLQFATIAQSLEVALTLPHLPNPGQSIGLDVKAERDITDAYDKRGGTALAQITTPLGGHWTGKGGISLEAASIQQAGNSDFSILASTPIGATLDTTNSLLDPKNGERLAIQAQPVFGTSGGTRAFLILTTDASAYRALDTESKLIAAARIRLGTILFALEDGIPADLRFYSGGGGSIRGFAYQHIGPRDALNSPTGGRALGETSFELRYRAWEDIGIVGFVDAGTVSASPYFSDAESPRIGAGLGLRYYTSFGPLRLDLATPLNPRHGDASVQVYISLGQAF